MSFQTQPFKIVPGGLNLISPGDRVPDEACAQLLNFRVDDVGRLRSRRGTVPLTSALGGGTVHTIWTDGTSWYVGAGGTLYRDLSTSIQTGFDGYRLGLVQYGGFTWIMNRGGQYKDNGTLYNWSIAAPTTALTATDSGTTGNVTGNVQYFVTVANDWGQESGPSPGSVRIDVTDTQVSLSDIPTSADPQVTKRRIYRRDNLALPDATLVLTIDDNTTTTATDDLAAQDAQDSNITLNTLGDVAPAGRLALGPFFGRVLVFGSAAHPARMWYSDTAKPWLFSGSTDEFSGSWQDVGGDKDEIVWATMQKRVVIVYKQNTVWRIPGDPARVDPDQMAFNRGVLGPRAIAELGEIDYFATYDGIFSNDGDFLREVSGPVAPIFRGEYVNLGPATVPPLDGANRDQCVMAHSAGQVYFFYPEPGNTLPNIGLVYDIKTDRWSQYQHGVSGEGGFTALLGRRPDGDMLGAAGSKIYAINEPSSTTDAGSAIPLVWNSPFLDQGTPENDKNYEDITFEYKTDSPLTVKLYFNNDEGVSTELAVGSLTSNTRTTETFKLASHGEGVRRKNVAVRVDGNLSGEATIFDCYIHYYVLPRSGKSFDSGETELGTQRVKRIAKVELDVVNHHPIEADIYSDLPGNAMTSRQTLSIPGESGGTMRPYRATTNAIDGRRFRITAHNKSTPFEFPAFQLSGARVYMRTFGEYVEAYESQAGFVWDSLTQDFGSNNLKDAKNLHLWVDTEGPVTVQLLTDQPGNAMAVRKTITLEDTNGERTLRFPLDGIEGRLWQIKFSGSSAYRIFKAAIELREVGVLVENYEADQGATWDSTELDFGTHNVKQLTDIELEVASTAALSVKIYSDLPGTAMTLRQTITIPATGRRTVTRSFSRVEGRLIRVVISGTDEWRLYGMRLHGRTIGVYVDADTASGTATWQATPIDFGVNEAKEVIEAELNLDTDGAVTFAVESDLPGNSLLTRYSGSVNTEGTTTGQRPVQIPTGLITGRIYDFKVTTTGSAFRLYGGRVKMRPIGTFIEAYEAAAGATYDSGEVDLGDPRVKEFEQLRFHIETEGPVTATIYTDLPGEVMTSRHTLTFNTQDTTTGERIREIELPFRTEGRLIRVVLSGTSEMKVFSLAVGFRAIPVYITNQSGPFYTRDYDFGDERVKMLKELEIVCDTDNQLFSVSVGTELPGHDFAARSLDFINTESTTTGRDTLKLRLPGNIQGRLIRVTVGPVFLLQDADLIPVARIFKIRVRMRVLGDEAGWAWVDIPMPEADQVRRYADLPVKPTPALHDWVDLPMEPTQVGFSWFDVPVRKTSNEWRDVEFPVEPSSGWQWVDIPPDQIQVVA